MSETANTYYCDKCMKEIISPASYWVIDNHRYCQECYKLNFSINAEMKNKDEQIAQLKQQLAEKEKAHMEAMGNALNDFLTLRQELQQDKISFAVEQLQKVKEYADIDYRKHCYIDAVQLDKFIDNQIEELRKEMK